MIDGPIFLGNLRDYPQQNVYAGFWGYGGVVPEVGGQLNLGHLASTVAALLRVQSPVTAAQSLVDPDGNPLIPETKKVAS